jgi:hypothetical protein
MNKNVLKIVQKDVKDLTGEDAVVYVPCNWVNSSIDVNLQYIPINKKLVYVLCDDVKSDVEKENEETVVIEVKDDTVKEKYDFDKKIESVDLPEEYIKPAPQVKKRGRPKNK